MIANPLAEDRDRPGGGTEKLPLADDPGLSGWDDFAFVPPETGDVDVFFFRVVDHREILPLQAACIFGHGVSSGNRHASNLRQRLAEGSGDRDPDPQAGEAA